MGCKKCGVLLSVSSQNLASCGLSPYLCDDLFSVAVLFFSFVQITMFIFPYVVMISRMVG